MPTYQKTSTIIPSDVAKYFLYRATQDGELISPLKMQKLVYYGYAWTLVKNKEKLFKEQIEAWPNGPVIPSLYRELRGYESSPISAKYLGVTDEKGVEKLENKFPSDIRQTLDEVYEEYMTMTAFELVVLVHSEKPWMEARKGLAPSDRSNNPISDDSIIETYGQAA